MVNHLAPLLTTQVINAYTQGKQPCGGSDRDGFKTEPRRGSTGATTGPLSLFPERKERRTVFLRSKAFRELFSRYREKTTEAYSYNIEAEAVSMRVKSAIISSDKWAAALRARKPTWGSH